MYEFINKFGLENLLAQMQVFFGLREPFDAAAAARNQYLLNINYETSLKFDTGEIINDFTTSAVVGTAVAGSVIVGNS